MKGLSEGKFTSEKMKVFKKRMAQAAEYFERHLTDKEYTVYRGMKSDGLLTLLETATPRVYSTHSTHALRLKTPVDLLIPDINKKKPIVYDEGMVSTSLNKGVSSAFFHGTDKGNVFLTIKIPPRSKALVLDFEGIKNVPHEEEVLLAPKTKLKFWSMRKVNDHYEIEAEVVS